MRSFIVNENYTSSEVSEIFQYTQQIDKQIKHRTKCKIKRLIQLASEQLFL